MVNSGSVKHFYAVARNSVNTKRVAARDLQVPIVVFALDPAAEPFREETSTIAVDESAARIRLRHSVRPGAALAVFNLENGKQAEFRVENVNGSGEVDVLAADPAAEIWDGARSGSGERRADREALQIALRAARQLRAEFEKVALRAELARGRAEILLRRIEEAVARADAGILGGPTATAEFNEPVFSPRSEPAPVASAPPAPAEPAAVPPPAVETPRFQTGPISWDDRRSSRRIQVKMLARIRHPMFAEVIQPLDLSRRGLGFESPSLYEADIPVWIALHYRDNALDVLETPARIVRVARSRRDGQHIYGVRFEN